MADVETTNNLATPANDISNSFPRQRVPAASSLAWRGIKPDSEFHILE
jgi:hypothetical protein